MKILSTTDYDLFTPHPQQRALNELNVKKLMRSMREGGFLEFQSITVSEDMVVYDGRHRLEAAKRLKIPVFYKIVPELKPHHLLQLQVQKAWTAEDYLTYGAAVNPHYTKLKEFLALHKMDLGIFMRIMGASGGYGTFADKFRTGRYVFNNDKMIAFDIVIKDSVKIIDYLEEKMLTNKKYLTSVYFRTALIAFLNDSRIEPNRFWEGLHKCVDKVHHCNSLVEYMKMWYEIYNYQKRNRVDYEKKKGDK